MNEERMDVVLEQAWEDEIPAEIQNGEFEGDEGEVGADITEQAQEESINEEPPVEPEAAEQPEISPELPEVLKGEPGKEHPLLTRVRERAREKDMERFLNTYPEVKANHIPREVWQQVAKGVPLVSAYAMHENQQLKMQLAAERQDKLNRQRTPGALGSHSGGELDELDRMWAEED